jgi:type I restriction enzyme S subunit
MSERPIPPQEAALLPDGYRLTELGALPEEWRVVRLGEVANVTSGGSAPQGERFFREGKFPFVRVQHLDSDGDYILRWDLITEEAVKKYRLKMFPAGTIVLPKSGASIRLEKRAMLMVDSYIVSHLCAIQPKTNGLDNRFLFYTLRAKRLAKNKAEGYPVLNLSEIKHVVIPLPPLAEQRPIAYVLRAVQRAREATERVIAATRELKKSLMQHLFTYGPVPVDATEDVEMQETDIGLIPAHWRAVRLGEVVEIKGGKRLPKGQSFSEIRTKYPYIRVVDLQNGSVNIAGLKYLTEKQHHILKRYSINKSDIYISIAGTIGLVGKVPDELDGAHLTENAAKLVLNSPRVDQAYLIFFLSSKQGQNQIHQRTTKTSQPKLALSRITEIPILLPPFPEQREIARVLQAVDEKIRAEEARRQALEALFKTLLHDLMTARRRLPGEFVQSVGARRRLAPTADSAEPEAP